MASDVLGEQMDIHSGGIDLAFPHHDNEIAQSEAHYNCKQWVNYFLHAGHLHIEGQKMSKSLKNFVTIKEALSKYTANQIRIMFLMYQWDAVLDFKDSVLVVAKDYEQRLHNFFLNLTAAFRQKAPEVFHGKHNFNEKEKALREALEQKQISVHDALCDSFNTPHVLMELRELMTTANTYLSEKRRLNEPLHFGLLQKVAFFISNTMKMFGVGTQPQELGWSLTTEKQPNLNTEEATLPFLKVLASYRDQIRNLAKISSHTSYLSLSDNLRDQLVELGVVLDDQADGSSLIKFVEKEILIQQREEKKQVTHYFIVPNHALTLFFFSLLISFLDSNLFLLFSNHIFYTCLA